MSEQIGRRRFEQKQKRPEHYYNELQSLLNSISQRVNGELGEQLVNDDCSVRMESFTDSPYPRREIDDDMRFVEDKERSRDIAVSDSVRDFYYRRYGRISDEKIIENYREEQRAKHGFILEMAVIGCLNKSLGKNYVAVRSSRYDDEHGVDTLIVNKDTGEIICGLDEVTDGEQGERLIQKKKKFEANIKRGGSPVKYGFTFEEKNGSSGKKLVRRGFDRVPTFYLRFSRQELTDLLEGMRYDIDAPNRRELGVLKRVVQSLSDLSAQLNRSDDNRPRRTARKMIAARDELQSVLDGYAVTEKRAG